MLQSTFLLPDFWLNYLWYGVTTEENGYTLTDEEKEQIDKFLSDKNLKGIVNFEDVGYYGRNHDALFYGAGLVNCYAMTFEELTK